MLKRKIKKMLTNQLFAILGVLQEFRKNKPNDNQLNKKPNYQN